jgi:hypothetical protein
LSEGTCAPGRVPLGWRPPGNGRPRRVPAAQVRSGQCAACLSSRPGLAGAGPRDWPRPFAGTETPSLGGTAESQARRLLPAAGPRARRVGAPGEHAVAHSAQAALLPSARARHGGTPAGGACGRTAVMRTVSGRQVTKRSRSPVPASSHTRRSACLAPPTAAPQWPSISDCSVRARGAAENGGRPFRRSAGQLCYPQAGLRVG